MAQIPNLVNIVSAFIQGAGSLVGADFGPGFCPAPLLDRLQSKGIFVPDINTYKSINNMEISISTQIINLMNIVSAFIQGAGSVVVADFGSGFCPAPLIKFMDIYKFHGFVLGCIEAKCFK